MGTITLNEKQRRRCEIITRLIANKISSSEASELLGRSSRQVRRMRQRYEAQGLETLVHGNQGRPSPRSTKPAAPAKPVRAPKTGAVKPSPSPAKQGLSILMVASEVHPYAKTGGLAEVAAALPDALGRLGHRVTLVLPRYHGVDVSGSRSQIT